MPASRSKRASPCTLNVRSQSVRVVVPDSVPCRAAHPSRSTGDVFCRIAPRKRHGRRPAPVLDVPAVGELRNAAGDLRTRETAHLAQVLPQQALVGALAGRVAKLPERVGPSSRRRRGDPST